MSLEKTENMFYFSNFSSILSGAVQKQPQQKQPHNSQHTICTANCTSDHLIQRCLSLLSISEELFIYSIQWEREHWVHRTQRHSKKGPFTVSLFSLACPLDVMYFMLLRLLRTRQQHTSAAQMLQWNDFNSRTEENMSCLEKLLELVNGKTKAWWASPGLNDFRCCCDNKSGLTAQHSTALHFSLYFIFGTNRTGLETSACESGFSQFCLFDQPSAEPPKQGWGWLWRPYATTSRRNVCKKYVCY